MSLKLSETDVPHIEDLNSGNIMSKFEEYKIGVGDYFTYGCIGNFKKGLRISPSMMIPIGGMESSCTTIEGARLRN